ncbi:demethoxyubiquinone hydroxylase family protein [Sphingomonas aliaeris]|uniref:3-demethoxyubiquinol 3-hydroxylase n=1 Tax=Sphingomonas aliaeris TaxID=2759526 RepID=A0A974NTE3_9SPHN|nr:demethoxyubiquinone hydroxylase family protein [Sphingomonas aliaeris]QQV76589.1 demethoxyubiquinone hydroxylase family protein [Sphingomonas aliaeris]
MNRWKPGDAKRDTDAMIRVDQAGEFGATRIYAGQLAVLGDRSPAARQIAGMAIQEERHRAFFDAMIARRGVRPTILQPIWDVAGFALGAATAAISPAAAMACTVAVETEIDKHYEDQLTELKDGDPELSAAILDFQAEEVEHRETALAAGAEQAVGYPVLSAVIRMGCRFAIATAKRI